MKHAFLKTAVSLGICLGVVGVGFAETFSLTNTNTDVTHTFTNVLGTAEVVDGMIVFSGELVADFSVPATTNSSGKLLASVQLVTQVKLFDELPSSEEVGAVQGAVVALRNAPESENGTYYGWATGGWVQLTNSTTATPFAVTNNATNYITFVFDYTKQGNDPVLYYVFIGETSSSQEDSQALASSTEQVGITSVSLSGEGSLQAVGSASGSPVPLSSSVGFSVYATAGGVLLLLDTQNEKGPGDITIWAKIGGEWVKVGTVQAKGEGSNHYEVLATSALAVGQAYEFKVIDEIGNEHKLGQPVEVKTIKMESVVMDASVIFVTFNSESGRSYQVLVADAPNAAEWVPSVVYYPTQSGEGYGSEPFTAAGNSMTIKIPRGANASEKAFFKIIKKD